MEWNLHDWFKGARFNPSIVTKGYYYAKISRLAMNQFVYDSSTLDNLFLIEKFLWLDGRVMIWYSDMLGWVITRCKETGYDINGIAIQWQPIFEKDNGDIPKPIMSEKDKCVVIYDLPSRMFLSNFACTWIDEIADIDETIKQQCFNQKAPLIMFADNPKTKDKIKNAIVDIANNVRAIILDNDMRKNDFNALNIESPFNISDLQAILKAKESEMLEYLGIDSLSTFQKKERLITDEQESNNQILTYLLTDRYNSRQNAIKKLNDKGLDISVSLNVTMDPNGGENDRKTENLETD